MSKEKLLLSLQAMLAQIESERNQPQISEKLTLLHSGYQHEKLLLDLYGTRDKDDIEVEAVALSGQTIDITGLFSFWKLDDFGAWLERKAAREYAERKFDGAIDRAEDAKQI